MSCLTCAALMMLILLTSTLAFPWSESSLDGLSKPNECDTNDNIETICQRCAKATKSNIVYPMCCQDREEARTWCYHYISFGIQGQ